MHSREKKEYKTCTLEYLTNALIVVKTKLSIIYFLCKRERKEIQALLLLNYKTTNYLFLCGFHPYNLQYKCNFWFTNASILRAV